MQSHLETPDFAHALTSSAHWTMVIVCALTMALVVGLHYEALARINTRLPRLRMQQHLRVLVVILALLAVHTIEIWIFGGALYGVAQYPELGRVQGVNPLRLLDAVYLSTVTFTTVGYGDLTPQGPLRLLLGIESLCGFMLVTWSASFTYLEMQRNWQVR